MKAKVKGEPPNKYERECKHTLGYANKQASKQALIFKFL